MAMKTGREQEEGEKREGRDKRVERKSVEK